MAISVVASSVSVEDFSASSPWSVDGPGVTILENDIVLLGPHTNSDASITTPTGFTIVGSVQTDSGSDNSGALYYKVAGAAEAGPYDIAFAASELGSTWWGLLRGVDPANPLSGTPSQNANTSGTAKDLSMTTEHDGAYAIMSVGGDPSSARTFTWDGGITDLLGGTHNYGPGTIYLAVGGLAVPTAGVVNMGGDLDSSDGAVMTLVAFRPAAEGGGSPTFLDAGRSLPVVGAGR